MGVATVMASCWLSVRHLLRSVLVPLEATPVHRKLLSVSAKQHREAITYQCRRRAWSPFQRCRRWPKSRSSWLQPSPCQLYTDADQPPEFHSHVPYTNPSIVAVIPIAKMSYASVKNPTPATSETITWNLLSMRTTVRNTPVSPPPCATVDAPGRPKRVRRRNSRELSLVDLRELRPAKRAQRGARVALPQRVRVIYAAKLEASRGRAPPALERGELRERHLHRVPVLARVSEIGAHRRGDEVGGKGMGGCVWWLRVVSIERMGDVGGGLPLCSATLFSVFVGRPLLLESSHYTSSPVTSDDRRRVQVRWGDSRVQQTMRTSGRRREGDRSSESPLWIRRGAT